MLSGVLADLASWRWIFFINVPVALVCLALLPRLVQESRSPVRRRLDWSGALLVTAGLVALIYALLEAGSAGWERLGALLPLLAAVTALAGFVLAEARRTDPLVPLGFLRDRTRGTAYLAALAVMAAFFATFFSLTLYLQDVLGFSPLRAGLAYVPYGAALSVGIAGSSALTRRFGPGRVLPSGLLVAAVGMLILAQLPTSGTYALHLLPGLVVLGVGNGLAIPAVTSAALSGVAPSDAGLASGMQNTVLQVGGAVGLAALVSVGSMHARALQAAGVGPAEASTAGFTRSFAVATVVLPAGAGAAAIGRPRVPAPSSPSEAPIALTAGDR